MGDFDFLEPIPKAAMSVKLPSKGVPYPKDHPANGGKLTIVPMTMLEESFFLDDNQEVTNIIDKVLNRCLQEKFDTNSLITSDKFFLFLMLRAVTYGSEYSFEWVCKLPGKKNKPCNTHNVSKVHIPNDFKMKYLEETDTEPFVVTLPETKKQISFRLFRGADEVRVENHIKKLEAFKGTEVQKLDTSAAYRLLCHIVAVDGNSVAKAPEDKLLAFILSLPARDRQYLQDKINYYTPGLNTDVTVVCATCGNVSVMDLPYTAGFFRSSFPDEEPEGTPDDEVRINVLPGDRL